MMQNEICDVLIVGAGMCGISLARELSRDSSIKWLMIDKAKSVGGRMATRRIDGQKFDHGAQFFTARSAEFKNFVDGMIKAGVVREWTRGFNNLAPNPVLDGHPRYSAINGMNQLPKRMIEGLPSEQVIIGEKITGITCESSHWVLKSEAGKRWGARNIVLTMPAPQAADLLGALDDADFTFNLRQKILGVDYDPCVAVMGFFQHLDFLGNDSAYQFTSGSIAFISDNGAKHVSPQRGALTIHLSAEASRLVYDLSEEEILNFTLQELRLKFPSSTIDPPNYFQVHRWKFASPRSFFAEPFLECTRNEDVAGAGLASLRLFYAGEAFLKPTIEGAFLSGLAVAKKIKSDNAL